MKVVIVEDELHAFQYLTDCLHSIDPVIEILSHLESVEEAVNYFQLNQTPDLIFLDIELADGRSFEIFDHVVPACPIIFTTAYDQFALEAFKLFSIDYLLKPIEPGELRDSIDKYKKHFYKTPNVPPLNMLIEQLPRAKKNRCLVKKGNHFGYIELNDLAYVESEDSITFLYTLDGKRHIYNKTVESFMRELDETHFFQINRSQIIKIDSIREVHPYFNQRLKLVLNLPLKKEREFIVSRSRMSDFKNWMDR